MAGETGSGKTTQLPKICLELGRGVRGAIAHTQPRRLAARTVAERIADELNVTLGEAVGYAVRFSDHSREDTLLRLLTDGLLLAEIQRDRLLRRYDTIIIDEAHERSLNIDFLLGYLKRILPARPDLKVIITSATIDPERFAAHFDDAPIIEVSGRTFPVEVRYRPAATRTQTRRTRSATPSSELLREKPGDILVFLSGEREIRDTADALEGRLRNDVEILPLFARQSTAAQQRVWKPHSNRRVVLATNVAETSLTVPGIRYVVDPGTARISRYSARLKVQRLPIEPVSQASADQRKGRCGRVAEGIAIRLYDEEDFDERPALHRPRDPAHQPRRGDPADGGDRPRRRRGLPVPGPAGQAPGARRHRAAAGAQRARRDRPQAHAARPPARRAADRPADGPDGARGRPARLRRGGDRDRRRAVDPGRARAPRRPAGPGRPGARPPRRRELGLPRLSESVALPAREARRAVGQPVPQAGQGRVPALPADPRVAGPRRPDPPVGQGRRDHGQPHARRARGHPPGDPDRAALAPRPARRQPARLPRRARRALRAVAGQRGEGPAELGDGRRAGRDLAAVGPDGGADRSALGRAAGRARDPPHATTTRAGRRSARRSSPPSG